MLYFWAQIIIITQTRMLISLIFLKVIVNFAFFKCSSLAFWIQERYINVKVVRKFDNLWLV